jgi:hypothetical protein
MTANYVIPICPGADPGADWQEMGWDSHANAALAHVAWCPNHPGYWKNGPAVMWEIFLQQLDPDEPVPLTLPPRGYAALVDDPGPVEAVPVVDGSADEWSCETCGAAYFGARPDDGLCGSCRAGAR